MGFGHEVCGILAPGSGIEPTPFALEGKVPTAGPPGKSLSTVFTSVPCIPNPGLHLQLLISSEHLPPKACSLLSSPNSLHAELNLRPLRPSYLLSGWPQTLPSLSFPFLPPSIHLQTVRFIPTPPWKPGLLLIPPRAKPPSLTAP